MVKRSLKVNFWQKKKIKIKKCITLKSDNQTEKKFKSQNKFVAFWNLKTK